MLFNYDTSSESVSLFRVSFMVIFNVLLIATKAMLCLFHDFSDKMLKISWENEKNLNNNNPH